jgi:hypothetical protein
MKITRLLHASLLLTLPQVTAAAAFTPGNLVVLRVGSGTGAISNVATAVFLDEYNTAGTLVQTVAIPSTGAAAMTVSGTATSEGVLSLSQDGSKICFAGYRKDAGQANPVTDLPATTNRVVGLVGADGVVDTATAVTDATGNFRNAVAATAAGPFYFATNNGLRYAAGPGAAVSSTIIETRNTRQVLLNGDTLYGSNASTGAAVPDIHHYGALPTTATTATVVIGSTGTDAVAGFWFADLSDTVAGADTLYLAVSEARIRKYSLVGSAWVDSGTFNATGVLNLTGITTTGSPERTATLFYTTSTAATGTLNSVADTSGYNAALSATIATLGTAGANKAFRGISVVPGGTAPAYEFAGATFPGADVQLTWTGTAGAPPVIEFSENLAAWNPLGTTTEAPAGTYKILDTPPVGTTRRFYRIAP